MQSAFPQKNVLSSATIFNRSRGNGACRGNREFGNEICGNVSRDSVALSGLCCFSFLRRVSPYAVKCRAVGALSMVLNLNLETIFEIEHIYARNRLSKENSLSDSRNLESLGNKALLEKRINIRAADYRFEDKKKYYQGFNGKKEKTGIVELIQMSEKSDFTEQDIVDRYKKIMDNFIDYLAENDLLQ